MSTMRKAGRYTQPLTEAQSDALDLIKHIQGGVTRAAFSIQTLEALRRRGLLTRDSAGRYRLRAASSEPESDPHR